MTACSQLRMIIAMAGHVDHGKTSLIRALTGIDPDRLPDEKQRGMTIDLGFAHAPLPGGGTIGFVDVPGHERFLGNMLAGVLAVDSVLLVVAADDGPMPQTEEHLAILRLVGIHDLTAVITKVDRVDDAHRAAAEARLAGLLARTGFGGAPILRVSAVSGEGIESLRDRLASKAAAWRPRPADGRFRLPIDRVFVIPGAGLMVTGTIAAGSVRVGDRLVVSPSRLAARVRSVQRHHDAAESAQAGDRCALALSGPQIERGRVHRGDWLVDAGLHAPTARVDMKAAAADARLLRHGTRVRAHLGAAAIGARALVLSGTDLEPGTEAFVALALERPVPALYGDRIVLRDEGTGRVVAGGSVIDPFTPDRRVRREIRTATLAAMAEPDEGAALAGLLATEGWVDLTRFILARNLDAGRAAALADAAGATRIGRASRPVLLSATARGAVADWLLNRLRGWHMQHPELPGPTKAALLGGAVLAPVDVAEAVLLELLADGMVVQRAAAVSLPEHEPKLGPVDEAHWQTVRRIMADCGRRAPRVRELAEALTMLPEAADALLVRLERFGLLLRVAPNRFFLPETVAELGSLAEELDGEAEGLGFTAATYNQRSGIGRNLTIQVLEYLDRLGITHRSGEYRHVVRPAAEVLGC